MLGKTVGDLFDYMCVHYRDRTAIVSGERRLSFNDLHDSGTRPANALTGLGFEQGDRSPVMELLDFGIGRNEVFLAATRKGKGRRVG